MPARARLAGQGYGVAAMKMAWWHLYDPPSCHRPQAVEVPAEVLSRPWLAGLSEREIEALSVEDHERLWQAWDAVPDPPQLAPFVTWTLRRGVARHHDDPHVVALARGLGGHPGHRSSAAH